MIGYCRAFSNQLFCVLASDDRVLDVACGTGSLSIAISEQAAEGKGIDLSEEMIAIANDAANSKGITNVEFLNSDASDLSLYKNDSFDVAVTSMAIHQFDPDLAIRILKEMRRIARQAYNNGLYVSETFWVFKFNIIHYREDCRGRSLQELP